MKINKFKKANYNPRKMSKASRKGLAKSIEEFNDISGIVINERTNNILAGNHRWEELCKQFGKSNLELINVVGEFYGIYTKEPSNFTNFMARVVDWDVKKEKAANVTANNDLLSGEFTSDLQDVLRDIDEEFDEDLMIDLRLDEMLIDLGNDLDLDDIDSNSFTGEDLGDGVSFTHEDINEPSSRKKDEERFEDDGAQELKVLKITVPIDLKDEVKRDLMEFLATKEYYDEITLV